MWLLVFRLPELSRVYAEHAAEMVPRASWLRNMLTWMHLVLKISDTAPWTFFFFLEWSSVGCGPQSCSRKPATKSTVHTVNRYHLAGPFLGISSACWAAGSLVSCTQRPQNTAENSQGSPGWFMKSTSCGDRHARSRAGQVLFCIAPLLKSTVF